MNFQLVYLDGETRYHADLAFTKEDFELPAEEFTEKYLLATYKSMQIMIRDHLKHV